MRILQRIANCMSVNGVIKVKKSNQIKWQSRYGTNRRKSSATNADFAHLLRATHTFATSFIFHHRSQFSLFLSEVRATFKSVSYTHTTVKTSPPLRRKDPFSPTQLRSVHARKCHSHTRNILLFLLLSFLLFSLDSPPSRPARYIRSASLYNDTRNRL